ncbi:MAG TPA: hypothetical protein VLT90_04010 [Terriglobales bacterium]|nr:hypothetical protein [Terriglobales bacterium]
MPLPRPIVLVLSSDPAFSRQLTSNWPVGADTPEFVLLDHDLCSELRRDTYDLAIADANSVEKHCHLKEALAAVGKPAILICAENCPDAGGVSGPILELPREPRQWPVTVALVGREILRRSSAESRTRASENARAVVEAEATLGRYMVEMRNNVNNAITSVLGNAELLLQEPGLPAPVQAQADTIRNMALRLNEVFQRFSSIEKELDVAARESAKAPVQARAARRGR